MRVFRIGHVFNHKDKEGVPEKGVIEVSRSKGYEDYVLTDPDNPNITGTNVPRLRLVHLGGRSVGVTENEIQRVVTGLEDWHATKVARRADKKSLPHRASAQTAR